MGREKGKGGGKEKNGKGEEGSGPLIFQNAVAPLRLPHILY